MSVRLGAFAAGALIGACLSLLLALLFGWWIVGLGALLGGLVAATR